MKILAIDDNPDNLTALKAVIADRLPGVEVLTAPDGPSGLAMAQAEDPDVILLDIIMPVMDGYAVCRKLKEYEELQIIPVLFLTALRTDRDSRIRALDAGAEGFVSKSFDDFELSAQIQAMARIKAATMAQRNEKENLIRLVGERTRELQQSQQSMLNLLEDLQAQNEAREISTQALRESEARLKQAQSLTRMGSYELDIVTGVWHSSTVLDEIFGIDEHFARTAEGWILLIHPDWRKKMMDCFINHGSARTVSFDQEYIIIRKDDGVECWVQGMGKLEINDRHQPVRMIGTIQDITQRKQAEEQIATLLNVQREMTRLATEFINVSMDRQDQAINRSLAMIGQLTKTDRTYLFAYDFAAGTARNTHEWCAEGITPSIDIAQAIPFEFMPEAVVAHRAGELVQIPSVADLPPGSGLRQLLEAGEVRSVVTLPLITDGSCHGFVGFDAVREERVWQEREIALLRVLAELYANFEARRNAERETRDLQTSLIESRDAAQAAAQAKSLFLANMSHEIRTPLNAVLGYAQIMQRECQHCPTGGRLNAISRSGEHLLELLNDLLELVRSDAHQIELAPCDLDFHQVLADVRMMFVRLPDACGLELEFSHRPEVPRFIHADSAKVRQILVNLVGNAVKFTKQGTVRVAAAVLPGGGADGYVIAVAVEDTGCGIAPEEMERIFEIFEQAQPGRKNGKGVGLGLALSRRYARAMGGDVTVDSRAGGGSRFQFTFRARPVANSGADAAGRGEVLQAAPNQPVRHLLVVDDEPENREMLTDLLTAAGFSIETADTAEQALARLAAAGGVDLVLMDKRLPGMDGYQAIARLRELPGGRTLPVVVVTASGAADEQDLAFAAGADGYAAKPVKRKRLLQEIGRLAGVEYEYGEPPAAPPPEPAELAPDALARVPITQRELLAQTLRRGDVQTMRELIAGLADEHAALADRLGGLVEIYDYDSLNTLLEAAKGDPL